MQRLFLSLILSALIVLPAHFGYAVTDEALVLYLSFDEGTEKEVKDQSGHGNHGEIIANAKRVEGKSGKAVEITGEATDCVIIPNSDSLKITGEITLMAWIKSAGWQGSGDQWIDKNCHNGGENNSYGVGVFETGTQIHFFLGSGASRPTLKINQTPAENEWQHVAATYDGNEMRIYLNGELMEGTMEKGDPGFDFQGTNDSDLRIGCAKDRAQYTFNGAIDEVIIYSRALNEAEINEVMDNGPLAVSPKGRAATTWSVIKSR